MKALGLNLDYQGKGFVGVLQSSRYVEGDVSLAREAVQSDAEHLRRAGLAVIREKVEAMAADPGVPQNAAAASRSPEDRYFEFHVLIDGKTGPLPEEDMRSLRALSERFSGELRTPVPLSYNALRPSQRFLNLRTRRTGLSESMETVRGLERAIRAGGDLEVKKVIAEYVCFDNNRAVDNGWLEPLP